MKHFYVKFHELQWYFRYCAEKQTDRQTPVKTVPARLPLAWVIISRIMPLKQHNNSTYNKQSFFTSS